MTEQLEKNGKCPECGGSLVEQTAHIPFMLDNTVIVVQDVPADVCGDCNKPQVSDEVTDHLMPILKLLLSLNTDVSMVSYDELASVGDMSTG